jgi:hypothetical protein
MYALPLDVADRAILTSPVSPKFHTDAVPSLGTFAEECLYALFDRGTPSL